MCVILNGVDDSLHTKGTLNSDMYERVIHHLHPGNGHKTVLKREEKTILPVGKHFPLLTTFFFSRGVAS